MAYRIFSDMIYSKLKLLITHEGNLSCLISSGYETRQLAEVLVGV